MRTIIFLLLTFLTAVCFSQTTSRHLFLITENDRMGYIDSTGEVVIKPHFRMADDFSEGLAAVRLNGVYGYIEETGDFVIPPKFDFATAFQEGMAIVYQDGKPFFIHRNGEMAFDCNNYEEVGSFQQGRAIVKTETNKFGMIDKNGRLVADTVYESLSLFKDGLASVQGVAHDPDIPETEETDSDTTFDGNRYENFGVIDSHGNLIIPYGKYGHIEDYEDGFFKVTLLRPYSEDDLLSDDTNAIVDRSENVIISRVDSGNNWIERNIHPGFASENMYKCWFANGDSSRFQMEKLYGGYMNAKGENALKSDTNFLYIAYFTDNRAFIKREGIYSIIDQEGRIIANNAFNDIEGSGFQDGLAIVAVDGKWGLIDTGLNYVIKPQYFDIKEIGKKRNFLIFVDRDLNKYPLMDLKGCFDAMIKIFGSERRYDDAKVNFINQHKYNGPIVYDFIMSYFYFTNSLFGFSNKAFKGIVNKNGAILMKPSIQVSDPMGFRNGLLKCIIDDKLTYINGDWKLVWQEVKDSSAQLSKLNIDVMNRNYFYTYPISNNQQIDSKHFTRKIPLNSSYVTGKVSLVVDTTSDRIFLNKYKGYEVTLVNRTNHSVKLDLINDRIEMTVQAKDKKGNWKDIEYTDNSWNCTGGDIVTFQPNHLCRLVTPQYEGSFKTKLRIKMRYLQWFDKPKNQDIKEFIIYSNEYDGSINPGQFWRKPVYQPDALIDTNN